VRTRIAPLDLETVRPNWLTAGAIRLGVLSLFVVLTAMVRGHLTHRGAGWLLLAGALFVVAGVALFALATRRVALRLPFLDRSWRATDAVLLVLRRIGLPLVGLAFFLVWTFVYIGIWWVHPHDAFRGLEPHPRFADFFYTAVSTAFISPPGDIVAHSRGARAATVIEMLTAFALVTAYAGSFFEVRRTQAPVTERPPSA
jgi:hypothetical protein